MRLIRRVAEAAMLSVAIANAYHVVVLAARIYSVRRARRLAPWA